MVRHVGDDLGRRTYVEKIKDGEMSKGSKTGTETRIMRLAKYVLDQVAPRQRGPGAHNPSVVMKMDIEGAEIEVNIQQLTK